MALGTKLGTVCMCVCVCVCVYWAPTTLNFSGWDWP
jgi:hypothetical protein